MFEARLTQGDIFKKIIESIKDLVTDCNIDCSEEECAIQCMDSAHVSLVAVRLSAAAFDHYRCDRPNTLGVNTANMAKIFKMMNNDDTLTLKAEDNADSLTMMFEGGKADTIADFGAYACCGIPDGNLHKVLQYILLFYSISFCSLSKYVSLTACRIAPSSSLYFDIPQN
jgi:proliferating cell nuclear antigen PCNA